MLNLIRRHPKLHSQLRHTRRNGHEKKFKIDYDPEPDTVKHVSECRPARLFVNGEAGYRIDFDTTYNGHLLRSILKDYLENLARRLYFVTARPDLKAALELEGYKIRKVKVREDSVKTQQSHCGHPLLDENILPARKEEEKPLFTQATSTMQTTSNAAPGLAPNSMEQLLAPTAGMSVEEPEYRINFEKHKGKTLDEVSESYRQFLANRGGKFILNRPKLKAALEKRGYSVVVPHGPHAAPGSGSRRPSKKERSKKSQISSFTQSIPSMPTASNEPLPTTIKPSFGQAPTLLQAVSNDPAPVHNSSSQQPLAMQPGSNGPTTVSTPPSTGSTPKSSLLSSARQPLKPQSPWPDVFATPKQATPKTHWTPPNLYNAPTKFRHGGTNYGGLLWISSWDTRSFFGLTIDHFLKLPLATFPGNAVTQQRYWLYHVWDLVRFETSEGNANKLFADMFLNQINEETHDVWGRKLLSKKDVARKDTTLTDVGYGLNANSASNLEDGGGDVEMV
ncbi:uncharacterized protein PAC_17807 [Phialocephala subalpina]|uniref:Uncharacterized protein n=1 Tax=Phialocephala subalpina TaxID=576137 RepID=A0A1L7XSH3_9HELO|nr:uncharacterized protein PAC_17807 [Phialocephala subalpina]